MISMLLLIAAQSHEAAIETYFEGELDAAGAAMSVGGASLIASSFFLLAHDGDFLEGMAYPIAAIGVVEIIVASVLYARTDDQVAGLLATLKTDPEKYRREERERMERVNFGFGIYKWVELGIGLAGVATGIAGTIVDRPLISGIGWGTALQAAFAFIFDWFAEKRAEVYTESLR
jgi:hypothetical protein